MSLAWPKKSKSKPKSEKTKKQTLKRKTSQKALKPGAISAFHAWRKKQQEKEQRLADLMLSCAPSDIGFFVI